MPGRQAVTVGVKTPIEKYDMLYLNLVQENLLHLILVQERRFNCLFHPSFMSSSLQFCWVSIGNKYKASFLYDLQELDDQ